MNVNTIVFNNINFMVEVKTPPPKKKNTLTT